MRFLPIAIIVVMALLLAERSALADTSTQCEGYSCNTDTSNSEVYSYSSYDSYYEEKETPYTAVLPSEQNFIGENVADYSDLPRRISSHGERVFIFSPRLLRWAAYDNQGYRVSSGIANGGADMCEDLGRPCHTPGGTYRIHSKKGVDCISNTFPLPNGGAQMPYCMFFQGGYAIHGSPYISGSNTSHGCIRVHTGAAKWLHRYFLSRGTKVVILPY